MSSLSNFYIMSPMILEQSSDKVNIFVSHEHKDAALLSKLKNIFSFHGINIFLAHEDIPGGNDYLHVINQQLNKCDVFILHANEQSMKSIFCNQEIGFAISKEKPFLTIADDTTEEFHWGLMKPLQVVTKIIVENPDYFKAFKEVFKAIIVIKGIRKPIFVEYKKKLSYLEKNQFNGFLVHKPKTSNILISTTLPSDTKLPKNEINLVPDGWNDGGFNTTFHICLGQYHLGRIKICYAGQMEDQHTYNQLPERFLFLPRNFLSSSIQIYKHDLLLDLQYLLNDYNVMERHLDLQPLYNSKVVSNSIFRDNPVELQKFRSQNARPSSYSI